MVFEKETNKSCHRVYNVRQCGSGYKLKNVCSGGPTIWDRPVEKHFVDLQISMLHLSNKCSVLLPTVSVVPPLKQRMGNRMAFEATLSEEKGGLKFSTITTLFCSRVMEIYVHSSHFSGAVLPETVDQSINQITVFCTFQHQLTLQQILHSFLFKH